MDAAATTIASAPAVSMVIEQPSRKQKKGSKQNNKNQPQGKKDPYEEVIEMLQAYDEGNKPRDLTDYEM